MGADASVQGWSEELSNIAMDSIELSWLVCDPDFGGRSLINECLHLRAEVTKLRGMVQDLALKLLDAQLPSLKLLDTQLPGPDLGVEG